MNPKYSRIQKLIDERTPSALATVVESHGSTPRKPGSRMIVFPDGMIEGTVGGGALEKKVIEESLIAIKQGQSKLIQIDLIENSEHSVGGICGGDLKVFIEILGKAPRLLIFGAGHVGQTLAQMAIPLEFDILLFDDRPEFTDHANYADGIKTACGPFEDAMKITAPREEDYIVIMTYKFTHDSILLKNALETPARYIGMIGSEVKCLRVMKDLENQGISQSQLQRVHAPIGLDIGAHTPAEVAVSTLAQIVKLNNESLV